MENFFKFGDGAEHVEVSWEPLQANLTQIKHFHDMNIKYEVFISSLTQVFFMHVQVTAQNSTRPQLQNASPLASSFLMSHVLKTENHQKHPTPTLVSDRIGTRVRCSQSRNAPLIWGASRSTIKQHQTK